ncbi:MAG: TraR/DksA family transcriptional regulator [Woeseiaceae bacterium]|nr:TraR/DksA family transcriptional regulator [Woeseiaceae bacterium]
MKTDELERFRQRLEEMRAAIEALAESRRQSSEVVELDQTRTGRLSRMDALQLQAMAQAGQARSEQELRRIDAALARLQRGEFGECIDCGEDIPVGRLDANPAVTLCVGCASARERR